LVDPFTQFIAVHRIDRISALDRLSRLGVLDRLSRVLRIDRVELLGDVDLLDRLVSGARFGFVRTGEGLGVVLAIAACASRIQTAGEPASC
jgi:hypothetical protein